MTEHRLDGLSQTARAFATYSLVPYLGIVFCPGAVLVGTVGVLRPRRERAGRTACYVSAVVGVVVLIAQLLLWWILYQVPLWAIEH